MANPRTERSAILKLLEMRDMAYFGEVNLPLSLGPCRDCIKGGYIDELRIKTLLERLHALPGTEKRFPINFLEVILAHTLKNGLSPDYEAAILDIIVGTIFERRDYFLTDLLRSSNPVLASAIDYAYDEAPEKLSITNKFVAFTGTFVGMTRKQCFKFAETQGGVAADPANYTDYLFVAEDAHVRRRFTSTINAALIYRFERGRTLILHEIAWASLIKASQNQQ